MLETKQIWVMFLIVFVDVAVTAVIFNIASKFVYSNSIARACFIFLLCTLMTSANKSLEKKRISYASRLRLEQLLRIFRALQTSRVLRISMNARWRMNQLLNFKFLTFGIILPYINISSPLPPKNGNKSETSTKIGSIEHHLSSVKTQGL